MSVNVRKINKFLINKFTIYLKSIIYHFLRRNIKFLLLIMQNSENDFLKNNYLE